ncbi:MAG: ABC transporter permease [Betaproteobacteria bacterium]|nr:ABC transporter permease [Betaproteobacteria bacterium]MCL2886935.1 ABC transporter permease [Betaproteobacteria bacterium]
MMDFQIVVLWSDILVWLLLAAGIGVGVLIARSPPLRAAWRRVGGNRIGMAAATVLLAFIVVGLLDSLHYRAALASQPGQARQYAVEVLSLLDALAKPLRVENEKTYSAPFATRLYAKETLEVPGLGTVREFPRLQYGGSHLGEREDAVLADAAFTAFRFAVLALLAWLALAGAAAALVGARAQSLALTSTSPPAPTQGASGYWNRGNSRHPDPLSPLGGERVRVRGAVYQAACAEFHATAPHPGPLPASGARESTSHPPCHQQGERREHGQLSSPQISATGWQRIWCGETAFAWDAVLATLAAILLVALPLFALAGQYHVFGTDKVGQDVLYQILKSVRTALIIGLVTTLVMLPLAVLLGIVAGYFRGWVDDVIQYLYTVLNSIPGVLLIAAAVLMMQVIIDTHPQWFATAAERADLRLLALCFILGITSWTGLCRLLRGETLKLRELEYIQAAQAFGVSSGRIILRHILPNLMHIVIIALVMDFSSLVLAEAVLSYVGIGVDPSMTSFGTMINNARMELGREPAVWWSLTAAFAAMFLLVLAANLFADAVRDAFDPRAA